MELSLDTTCGTPLKLNSPLIAQTISTAVLFKATLVTRGVTLVTRGVSLVTRVAIWLRQDI